MAFDQDAMERRLSHAISSHFSPCRLIAYKDARTSCLGIPLRAENHHLSENSTHINRSKCQIDKAVKLV
jgi:hypothetical protein